MAKQKHTEEVAADAGVVEDDTNKGADQDLIDARIEQTHKLIDRIEETSEDAKNLKILPKYVDCWGNFEQVVDEQTIKYQTEIKNIHKLK
jgi:hypothetical protein